MMQKRCKHLKMGFVFSILLSCLSLYSYGETGNLHTAAVQQQNNNERTVKGIVYDESGEPVIGATVIVKDYPGRGVVTNVDGQFSINVPQDVTTLTISYVGMKPYVLSIQKSKPLYKIYMKNDTNLEEVVVTGIVSKRKESFTGSASTFNNEQLKAVGAQNAIASLKTLDPSFNVLDSEFGSDPNRMPNIEIRGKSSLISTRDELAEDPNQPLFILDGFETTMETIYNMDMNRIESITLLKDAASTAIYGSRAANGVVVVETIKPKSGKLNVSYNGSVNVSWADLTSYNLMNASEKLEFDRLVGRYSNFQTVEEEIELLQSYNNKLADIARGVDTYWLSDPLRTGVNHRHSVYADGGEGAFMFGLGVTYNGITGVMKDSKRNNIGANIDLTYRLNKLQFINKFSFDNTDTDDPIVGFSDYANANPYYPKYNENGMADKWLEKSDLFEAANPLYNAAQNSYNKGGSSSISDRFIVEYMPMPEMRLRARFGITHNTGKSENFASPKDTRFSKTYVTERGLTGIAKPVATNTKAS